MMEADVIRLSMEVEAAAARNADLSRQVDQLHEELALSTACSANKVSLVTEGTQADFTALQSVALDLDDLLFEVSEMMFRLYPTSSVDLSTRGNVDLSQLAELSQRCLHGVRSLRTAWETKLDGYNQFIENMQKSHGEYYSSLELKECQLRVKEQECDTLMGENARLLTQCRTLEQQLKAAHEATRESGKEITRLLQRTSELEEERQCLLDREKAAASTLVSLRAECVRNPWSTLAGAKARSPIAEGDLSPLMAPHATRCTPTTGSNAVPCASSVSDMVSAFQGSPSDKHFPQLCLTPESVIDYYCKVKQHSTIG
uniref:Uncharacterized protein n=1 Tax=Trypanosoma congolense (strain IL3000) TaxID=1068625 RepID=G0UZ12_TRYCI|nr:conserved hypothetical protein [Trypanosoma congolense IL3000]